MNAEAIFVITEPLLMSHADDTTCSTATQQTAAVNALRVRAKHSVACFDSQIEFIFISVLIQYNGWD